MAAERLTRKKLKQDGFVASVEQGLEFVQKNFVVLGVVVLALVVTLVGISIYGTSRQRAQQEASRLLYEGQIALGQGAYGMAVNRLREVVEEHGGVPVADLARIQLANAQNLAGEGSEALATIETALERLDGDDPLRADALVVKGVILSDAGRPAEAADAYAEAIAGDLPPERRYELTLRLAESHRQAGQPRAAVQALENLRDAIASGATEGNLRDLDAQIAFYRALSTI
ncbi:MAG: tetratricopeptide repeat protein [Candidatus Krumholzibacteriia bacterium]